jgi:uncharacterized protein YbjQ (UPF0145 family)
MLAPHERAPPVPRRHRAQRPDPRHDEHEHRGPPHRRVPGIVVRTPSIGAGLVGAFKSIGGGNIKEYSDVCEAARHDAYAQMVQHAEQMGAHAIVAMHYDATEFVQGATEVLAYGTAVRVEKA